MWTTVALRARIAPRDAAGARARAARALCTSAAARWASPTQTPPNSPFTVFDRASKLQQRSRAALRRTLEADNTQFGDEATRGEPSRTTDYVRDAAAQSLADRIQDITRKFPTVVELGAGAGLLRRHLDKEGTGVEKIIMCDTSEALLNRDRHLDDKYPFQVERRVVDEELLPFEPESVDCIVASGSLHWTNDLPGALIQIQRALKPDGVFVGYLWGGDSLFELRTALLLAEQERQGGLSVRVSPMTDSRDVSSLLSRAGFSLQTVDVDEVTVGYPSMFELLQDLQDMGESNAAINRRTYLSRDVLIAAAASYKALHGLEDGTVPATFGTLYMIGWKPSESQRKPLERGSASHSLKDVL